MPNFRGFSEASLLYAQNLHIVYYLQEQFRRDQKRLFDAVEDAVRSEDWSQLWSIDKFENRISLRFPSAPDEKQLLLIQTGLAADDIAPGRSNEEPHFWAELSLGEAVEDQRAFKGKFERLAGKDLDREGYSRERVELKYKSKYLLRPEVEFKNEKVLEMMVDQIRRLQKFAKYAEQVLKKMS